MDKSVKIILFLLFSLLNSNSYGYTYIFCKKGGGDCIKITSEYPRLCEKIDGRESECISASLLVNGGKNIRDLDLGLLNYKKLKNGDIVVSYHNRNIVIFDDESDGRILLKEIDARNRNPINRK